MRFSIILPAYKESNINKTIKTLLKQELPRNLKLNKIYIVACGYENFTFVKNKKITIIKERRRRGKAHAINLAFQKINSETKSDIVVLQSGDTFLRKNTIKYLFEPFDDSKVGMTTGRPVSIDDPKKFVGFLNNLIWFLHHFVSLEKSKAGEALAFRNIIKKIPEKLVADEAYIEARMLNEGYRVVYIPKAKIFNNGPQTISDFIKQRRRIFAGHLHLKNKYGYEVSTMSTIRIIKAMLKYFETEEFKGYKQILWLFSGTLIEAYARILGVIDFYIYNKVPYIWEIVETSGR